MGDFDNFNYLLSNRVMGLAPAGTTISHDESVQKSIEGFTVQPARLLTSAQGATIDLTFRDTKTLEVYNCLRLWMLYMYKTYKGILAPSYNGYHIQNSYNIGTHTMDIKKIGLIALAASFIGGAAAIGAYKLLERPSDSFTLAEQFTGVSIFDKSGNLIF